MPELAASILKYLFTILIYLFIFGIMRLIYLDIKSMNAQKAGTGKGSPYLKLINMREYLDFKVQETYPLGSNAIIGRSDKNDIVIQDPFLSGRHARFSRQNGTYQLEDLESTNGTFVNRTQVTGGGVVLANGDRISMGQIEFLFVLNRK